MDAEILVICLLISERRDVCRGKRQRRSKLKGKLERKKGLVWGVAAAEVNLGLAFRFTL